MCVNKINSLLFVFVISTITQAQMDIGDSARSMYQMTLEDFINVEVEVTSRNRSSLRESPGIVTVLTERDIVESGARDLMSLLRMVPGIEFAAEVENTVGIGVRGIYGLEGKVLVLMDGQQLNETNYGSVVFGQNFMVDQIKKIEIIRGPGSSQFGGMAELSVINIVTKKGADYNGFSATSAYGLSNGKNSRNIVTLGGGKEFGNGLDVSFNGYYNYGNRYNGSYMQPDSIEVGYGDSAHIVSSMANFKLAYKGLKAVLLYQNNDIEYTMYKYDANWLTNGGLYGSVEYNLNVADKLEVIPRISVKRQDPWTYKGDLSETYIADWANRNDRLTGQIITKYRVSEKILVSAGSEFYQDISRKRTDLGAVNPFTNGESTIKYHNWATFGEVSLLSDYVNLLAGARYDNHSAFQSAFVPRFSATKSFDKFHFKLLASKAFRAPVIYNIEYNPGIRPEMTEVFEIEFGFKVTSHSYLNFNSFYNKIKDPIFYMNPAGYTNHLSYGTIGGEAEYRYEGNWGHFVATSSFYKNNNSESDPVLTSDPNLLRAFPGTKITLLSGIKIMDNLWVSPNVIFNSSKQTYTYLDPNWETWDVFEVPATLRLNLIINYNDIIKGLSASFGMYDLTNQGYVVINSYDAGSVLPLQGREFVLQLKYKISKS